MKEILSPGAKIRNLRERLGLKQEDIIGGKVSKSLISMIEQNKRSLTYQVAVIIAENLNKYYESLGEPITAEYLMETEADQIKKQIGEHLEHLKKAISIGRADEYLVNNVFEQTIELIKSGNFRQELMELKTLRGKFYYTTYRYKEAVAEYLDVLNYAIGGEDYGQIAQLYILLGSTYQMQLMMDTALVHYVKASETAIAHSTTNRDKIKTQSLFNQISVYRSIKRHDMVINHIGFFRELKWQDSLFRTYSNRIDLIEANTYRDVGKTEKAEVLYRRLLEKENRLDAETRFLLYENFGLLYRKLGDRSKALEYINVAFELRETVNLFYIPALYLYKATCYNLDEEYDQVIDLLDNALQLAEMVAHKHMTIELRFAFAGIFLELEDYGGAIQQLAIIDKDVHRADIKPLLHDLYCYYIDCYNGLEDSKKISEYTDKIRQKDYLWD